MDRPSACRCHVGYDAHGWLKLRRREEPLGRDSCATNKKCFAFGDDGSMPRFVPTNDPWAQASTNPLDWKPQLESNMLGFIEANGHIVPHFGNMQTFLVDKASHKTTHGIANNGAVTVLTHLCQTATQTRT